ncbi:MAG: efflux RND transporter periplasmic adaptor subunit [Acidobacteria bacterium]|nr:efflux RND transporter periplasmic adaptor subunit [Acidobacteriota bacterium]
MTLSASVNMPRAAFTLALLLGTAACAEPKEEIETSESVPVAVQQVRRGTIKATVWATGIVKPAPDAEMIVTAPQSARIAEIPKAEGESVRRGDLLVRFEIPSLHADQEARASDRARARARLENAQAAATRVAGLFARGIAAGKEVEDAERELAEAKAAVSEAEGGVTAAGLLGQRETVTARFDGLIAARFHNPGDLVEPGSGDPILRVIDPRRLQVEASVPLSVLAKVAVRDPVVIRGPEEGGGVAGVVTGRAAAVEPLSATARIRVAFTSPTALPAGTPVQIEIETDAHEGALLVPIAALVREKEESFLYVVDRGGHAHRKTVGVGIVALADAEILSGVAEGDAVIVQGQQALPDGAAVSVEAR